MDEPKDQVSIYTRYKYISNVIKKYDKIKICIYEKSCVIWLDDYNNDSDVSITNEQKDILHTPCHTSRYYNILIQEQIKWPHWNTENTDKPKVDKLCSDDIEIMDISREQESRSEPNTPSTQSPTVSLNNTSGRLI